MRTLTTEFKAELEAGTCRPAFLFSGQFSGQTLSFWTGLGALAWNSTTFVGNGYLTDITPISETEDVRADGTKVELSGVPQELVSIIFTGAQHGQKGFVWLAFLDEAGVVIDNPSLIFEGLLDYPEIIDSEKGANIRLNYESRLIALEVPRNHRYTYEGQRAFYPADDGFKFVPAVQEWNGFWGRS